MQFARLLMWPQRSCICFIFGGVIVFQLFLILPLWWELIRSAKFCNHIPAQYITVFLDTRWNLQYQGRQSGTWERNITPLHSDCAVPRHHSEEMKILIISFPRVRSSNPRPSHLQSHAYAFAPWHQSFIIIKVKATSRPQWPNRVCKHRMFYYFMYFNSSTYMKLFN